MLVERNRKKLMKCDNCGKEGAKVRKFARNYGKGDNLPVIEDVPVVSCPNCGESYMTAETLHEVERLKAYQKSLAKERRARTLKYA